MEKNHHSTQPVNHLWLRWAEVIGLLLIVLVGAWLRLYRLPETLQFRGDQGRDAIVAKRILKDKDIALIGPVTSVGNMYIGPFYYYFMVPFLALTYPDPVGPAYGVALVNILTIGLLYIVTKQLFGRRVAMASALLFTLSPNAVQLSRFSWNPNIAPFFALILLWAMYRWWQNSRLKYVVVMWAMLGILAQLHGVSLIMVGFTGLVMLVQSVRLKAVKRIFLQMIAGAAVLLITEAPLIAFDFRHDHLIWKQLMLFLTSPEKHVRATTVATVAGDILGRAKLVFTEILGLSIATHYQVLIIGIIFTILTLALFLNRGKRGFVPAVLVSGWLIISTGALAFYSHSVYIHYLSFCFPIIAIFWGWLVVTFARQRWINLASPIVLSYILISQVSGLRQLKWEGLGTTVAQATVAKTLPYVTSPYNITLLSDDHDYKGMIYRYFFEVSDKKPNEPDMYSQLKTLILIDEVSTPEPRSVPIYEITTAKDFRVEKIVPIPQGPQVMILKEE